MITVNLELDLASLIIIAISAFFTKFRLHKTTSLFYYNLSLAALGIVTLFHLLSVFVIRIPSAKFSELGIPAQFLMSLHYAILACAVAFFIKYLLTKAAGDDVPVLTAFQKFLLGAMIPCMVLQVIKPAEYSFSIISAVAALCILLFVEIPDSSGFDKIMTELEKSTAENKHAIAARASFLNGMGHEIRTPVTSILGLNEMILRESKDPAVLNYSEDIKSAADALLRLLNDILELSSAFSGDMEIESRPYNFPSLINDLRNMMSLKALDKGLYLIIKPDESIPKNLLGDHLKLKKVLINILLNAVQCTEKGGVTLTISAVEKNDKYVDLKFSCKDTGRGIKAEDREKVFLPFVKLEAAEGSTESKEKEGAGMGMSIIRSTLKAMGSDIDIQSIYGVGSIFTFVLRQEIAPADAVEDSSYIEAPESGPARILYHCKLDAPKASILVVDDTASTLRVFTELLKPTNIQIDTATSGEQALALASEKAYHAIFVDQLMPGMDGVDTMQAIRDEDKGLNIGTPFVAMTAADVNDLGQSYIEAGFNAFLPKPIRPEQLEKILIKNLPRNLVTLVK